MRFGVNSTTALLDQHYMDITTHCLSWNIPFQSDMQKSPASDSSAVLLVYDARVIASSLFLYEVSLVMWDTFCVR